MAEKTPYGDGFWSAFQPNARISARTFLADAVSSEAEPRLLFLRPRDDDEDPDFPGPDDEPPPTGDPCRGKPFVRAPLIAAQIDLGFGASEPRPCPSDADLERVVAAVRAQFRRVVPAADVRVVCQSPILTIAVWESWNGDACEDQARRRGLERLDLIEGTEGFGFLLRTSLISFQAARSFELAPKQLSGNGAPSSIGPIHLTGLAVEFVPPDTVITRVHGYDDRPLPDVGFTLTITDQIERNAEVSSTDSLDTHGAWKAVLAALLLGAGGVFLTPLLFPATLWALAGDISALVADRGTGSQTGVGGRALGLVPRQIPLPGRTKLLVLYSRSQVTKGALFFGAALLQEPRQPAAALAGPTQLVIGHQSRQVSAAYHLAIADTFGSLTINWQAGPGVRVERPNSRDTTVVFTREDLKDDRSFTRTLAATVSDQDGFAVSLTKSVEIFVADDDGLPPICEKHPSLPQCLPPREGPIA
jgi:hypothetical protein